MPFKDKTLVILSPGFPENETDTTCLPLQQILIRSVKQQYPELKLIVLAFQYPYKKRSYKWHGIPVVAIGGRSRGKLFHLYNWLQVWRALKRIKKTNDITGILSFWLGECAFIGERFARQNQLKHFCWILGQDAKPGNRYFRMADMAGDSLIALSDFIARSINTNYSIKPAHIIPGGVDGSMFGPMNPERNIDVLAAGSLISLKQYHLFIEVVCRLKKHIPNIKAVLCGNGPEKGRLKAMIRQLNMEDHIILTGEAPHREVLDMMLRSKVFLHTSEYEGLGMVCPEALYAGSKVISFVRPLDRYVQNWHIANTTLEMADIACSILKDPDTEYVRVAPFLITDTAKQIMQLYDDSPAVISSKRRAIAANESVEL